MYKVVIDTNVYISGTFWTGLPKLLLKMAKRKQFATIVSKQILDEIIHVLTRTDRPFKLTREEARRVVNDILSYAVRVVPTQKVTRCRHDKDNMILECALEGEADFIVTGDPDLLALKEYKGIKVVTARKLVDILALDVRK